MLSKACLFKTEYKNISELRTFHTLGVCVEKNTSKVFLWQNYSLKSQVPPLRTIKMNSIKLALILATAAVITEARPQEEKFYPARFQPELDSVNVDRYLKNDRLMNLQIKCVLYNGPCDVVGRWVKPRVAASFYGQCPLCTPKQKKDVEKIIAYMQEKRPEEYKFAIRKFLRTAGIELPSSTSTVPSNQVSTSNSQSEESVETTTVLPNSL